MKASLPEHYLILEQEKFTSNGWQTGKSLNPIHGFHDYEAPIQYKNTEFSREMIKACVNILTIQ